MPTTADKRAYIRAKDILISEIRKIIKDSFIMEEAIILLALMEYKDFLEREKDNG